MSIAAMPTRTGPWTLYRAFGAGEVLLYIGISRRVGGRMTDHQRTAAWWAEVKSLTFETIPDWDQARVAEDQAIAAENPRHNKARYTRNLKRPAPMPTPARAAEARRPPATLARASEAPLLRPEGASGPIKARLTQSNIGITCRIVFEDESAEPNAIASLSMRGAQREITASLINDWGYEPAGRWEAETETEDGAAESMRRFRPAKQKAST